MNRVRIKLTKIPEKRSIRTLFKEYHDTYPNENINKYSRPK